MMRGTPGEGICTHWLRPVQNGKNPETSGSKPVGVGGRGT